MLSELRVRDLGVIAELDVELGFGLTAITGETGTGKTLIVEALDLLCGGRADPIMVRSGASEAVIEGRFVEGADEHVVTRTVPRNGRSHAELDGKLATVASLEEFGGRLVDLYGQHAHQSLLRPGIQHAALDRFASIDLSASESLRNDLRAIDRELAALGGDGTLRDRELDLLRFEVAEIDAAGIVDADEAARLAEEEDVLSGVQALREASEVALIALDGSGAPGAPGASDLLGAAIERLARDRPFASLEERLRGAYAELADATSELRRLAESFEEDPERLTVLRERRELFRRLVRKHGESLADVVAAGEAHRRRIAVLTGADERREELVATRTSLRAALDRAELAIGTRRREAAPALAQAVERHFAKLALGRARLEIRVGEEPIGDDVEILLGANPGEPALGLAKVASGGELARTMLALRLVLTSAPETLVFDEVDAGIGGEAALAVGAALAELGRTHQVLVVAHLAQVAAHADHQFVVGKTARAGRTQASVALVDGEAREAELARMLSGQPESETARRHARELLAAVRLPGSS